MFGYVLTSLKTTLSCIVILGGIQSISKNRPHFKQGSTTCPPKLIPREVLFGNPDVFGLELSPDGQYLGMVKPYNSVLNIWVQNLEEKDGSAYPVTFDQGRGIRSYAWSYLPGVMLYQQDTVSRNDITFNECQISSLLRSLSTEPYVWSITTNSFELTVEFAYETAKDGGTEYFRAVKDQNGTVTDWESYRNLSFIEAGHTDIQGFHPKNPGKVIWKDSIGSDLPRLTIKDIDKPDELGQVLYESKKADIDGVFWPKFSKYPIYVSENYMRRSRVLLNETFRDLYDFLNKEADRQFAEWSISSYSQDFKTCIVAFSYDDATSIYYKLDVDNLKLTYLFPIRSKLQDYTLSRMYPIEVPVEDNFTQVCYLTIPRHMDGSNSGIPSKPLPMVLNVHGGPWARSYWGYDGTAQFMANRGYAVLDCNYRGSTGYGKKYLMASFGEWSKKMHNDLLAAVDWAVDNQVAINDKVAIYGGSYGGYAALVGATFTPDRFACAVDIVGVSNLITLLNTIPKYWEPLLNKLIKRIGGDHRTEEGKKFLRSISPINRVDQITKPLLIGQGANDQRVKINESQQIVDAMNKNKIPVSYIVFPNEGHGFQRPENQIAFKAVEETFLKHCLGGIAEPFVPSDIKNSSAIVREFGDLDELKDFYEPGEAS